MNPSGVILEPDEIRRTQRIILARWLGISPREWDQLSYAEQCDVMEVKRAIEENTAYDRAIG